MVKKRSSTQQQHGDVQVQNGQRDRSQHNSRFKQARHSYDQASPARPRDIFDAYNTGQRNHEEKHAGISNDKGDQDNSVTPLDRVALFRQLSDELEHDPEFAKQFIKVAGEKSAATACELAKVLNSDPIMLSNIAAEGPQAPHMPTQKQPCASIQTWFEKYPDHLPALPLILDPTIEARVFRSASYMIGHGHGSRNESYERLEWLGDAYLELITRRICHNIFTDTSEALPALVTQDFVRNENLARFALAYAFDDRLQLGSKHMAANIGSARKTLTKIYGDVFEAYIAGLIESDPSNGYQTAYNWIACLIKPKIMKYQNRVPVQPKAKEALARKVLGKGIKIEWEEDVPPENVKGGTSFSFSAYLTGWGYKKVLLGSGKAMSKSQAQVLAAMEALTNPTTAVICAIKKEYDALVQTEREKEGGPDPAVIAHLDKKYKEASVERITEH